MKRWRRIGRVALTALGLAYAGVTLGLILGYDSRALIDEFRGSIRHSPATARANEPRADDFWAQQGQDGSSGRR